MALASLNKHTEAVSYYKKALELDPENDTYKSNLKIAEQKMKETPSPVGPCVKSAVSVNINHTYQSIQIPTHCPLLSSADRGNGWGGLSRPSQ